jgi:hypothetical protein
MQHKFSCSGLKNNRVANPLVQSTHTHIHVSMEFCTILICHSATGKNPTLIHIYCMIVTFVTESLPLLVEILLPGMWDKLCAILPFCHLQILLSYLRCMNVHSVFGDVSKAFILYLLLSWLLMFSCLDCLF